MAMDSTFASHPPCPIRGSFASILARWPFPRWVLGLPIQRPSLLRPVRPGSRRAGFFALAAIRLTYENRTGGSRRRFKERRNAKHQDQWRWSLTAGAAALRSRPVDEIDTEAVLGVLKPLWIEKPETAARLCGRIEAVLNAAKAQGHRQGENRAVWRGHLSHLLPKRGNSGAATMRRWPTGIYRLS
jgi:hypothetical protein